MNAATRSARLARLAAVARLPRLGRVQRQIRRAFIANNYRPMTTLDLVRWCYPTTTKPRHWHTFAVRRAAPKFATPIGHRRCRGNTVIWALKPDALLPTRCQK